MGCWSNGFVKRFGVFIFAVVCLPAIAFSQSYEWTLNLWNGETHENVALQRLSNDTLYFLHSKNFPDWVLADSIAQLRRPQHGMILPATIIGSVSGGALGFALKPVARDQEEANVYSAVFGVVAGGVGGFVVGSLIQSDETFDFSRLDSITRSDKLKLLLSR